MNKTVVLDLFYSIFEQVDIVLDSYQGSSKMQVPNLVAQVGKNLDMDDKQIKEADPIIRYYIRNHDKWCSSRGRTGGIELRDNKTAKLAAKAAQQEIKDQLKASILAKIDTDDADAKTNDNPTFPLDEDEEDEEIEEDLDEDDSDNGSL